MKNYMKNAKQFLKHNYKFILLFICLFLFSFILFNVITDNIKIIDETGYNIVSSFLIKDAFTPVAKFFTLLAEKVFLAILGLFIFIASIVYKKRKYFKYGFLIYLNLLLSASVNHTIKHIVRRQRPTEYRLIDQSGYSFPSGHSMVSMAFYGFIVYLVFKHVKNKYIKIPLMVLLACIIPCIGISRIYLGVHYTSDVLAGFLLGFSYLIIFTSAIKKAKKSLNIKNKLAKFIKSQSN